MASDTLRKQGKLALVLSDSPSFPQVYLKHTSPLPSLSNDLLPCFEAHVKAGFSEKTRQSTQAQLSPDRLGHPRVFTPISRAAGASLS